MTGVPYLKDYVIVMSNGMRYFPNRGLWLAPLPSRKFLMPILFKRSKPKLTN